MTSWPRTDKPKPDPPLTPQPGPRTDPPKRTERPQPEKK